jgi:general secretion pathway protein E/type IV pilus assembly protein PilB
MEKIDLQKIDFSALGGAPYSREFMSRNGVVKILETDNQVTVAVADEGNANLINFIEGFHIPKKVAFYSVSKADFAAFIGETTNIKPTVEQAMSAKEEKHAIDTIAHDAPIINIINAVCIDAIRLEASDIHIEAHKDYIQIRYRIDGVLRIVKKIEKSIFQSISNRIKIMAELNTMEQRLPQDGRMTVAVGSEDIDLRVSVIPTTNGESIVLRIFNKSAKRLRLEELGFSEANLSQIKRCIAQPYGLILLTGPTGSGKTTTLHALLETLPVNELKIVTIEDPVEQLIPGINQVQINEEIALSFDGMLRRVLRQDPNVIMVGEIRDAVTAELALRSALTGHLIFSTLHTNDSVSVIARLEDMGLEPYLIAAVLRCAVAQRLVRKVCPRCAQKAPVPQAVGTLFKKYKMEGEGIMLTARKCEFCGQTGYRGRTVIGETLAIDPAIEGMIIQQKPAAEIADSARASGMTSMAQDALQKLAGGITTLSEIEREIML